MKAFTLIDLLVIVAVIAVIAAIAVPNIAGVMERANLERQSSIIQTSGLAPAPITGAAPTRVANPNKFCPNCGHKLQ